MLMLEPGTKATHRRLRRLGVSLALPPSGYWLAFTDLKARDYRHGPAVFEIGFKHWCPR